MPLRSRFLPIPVDYDQIILKEYPELKHFKFVPPEYYDSVFSLLNEKHHGVFGS